MGFGSLTVHMKAQIKIHKTFKRDYSIYVLLFRPKVSCLFYLIHGLCIYFFFITAVKEDGLHV